jgi:hypothetical protein
MNDDNENYNSRTADKFLIRLPEGMRDQLKLSAKRNHRSINSEIIFMIEQNLASAITQNNKEKLGIRN